MDDIKRKLTSRKFWIAVTEFVTLLVVAFHGTEEVAAQIAAIIMAGAAVVAYIIGEGLIDAAGARDDSGVIVIPREKEPPDLDEDDGK